MPEPKIKSLPHDPADDAAAQWFIRRDRGLSEPEQAAYQHWLQENASHAAALARVEKLWRALDPVFADRAIAGAPSDADLLAPTRRSRRWWWIPAVAAAAAAVAFLLVPRAPELPSSPTIRAGAILHPGPERLTLTDGSVVELAAQAKVDVQFSAGERRVRLVRGTAFFTVAKNPMRPFIVSTGEVSVRAVGTAFSVALDPLDVSVLVTEGRVRVQERSASGAGQVEARELSALDAGQQGVIRHTTSDRLEISVTRLTPAEIERALGWQGPRLEFADLPLAAVVAEFNRYSGTKLVIGDAATAGIRVGGNFRADHVGGFVSALEAGFNISAVSHGDEIILRQKSAP